MGGMTHECVNNCFQTFVFRFDLWIIRMKRKDS